MFVTQRSAMSVKLMRKETCLPKSDEGIAPRVIVTVLHGARFTIPSFMMITL